MKASAVVFRVAAGPRTGFGHLVRCRSLARVLGVVPVVSIRGTAATKAFARRAGWRVISLKQLWMLKPSVVVVDDPQRRHEAAMTKSARTRGVAVLSITALGISAESAVLDPAIVIARRTAVPSNGRVLIALGGGAHVFALAGRISKEIAARVPGADIVAAAGFSRRTRRPRLDGGRWIAAPNGLACELSRASVAVVAGGVTLFEACAVGVPSVAIAVVKAQRPAIRHLASRRALVDARHVSRVAGHVASLLGNRRARRLLSSAARRAVDGRGAFRIADQIRRLADAA